MSLGRDASRAYLDRYAEPEHALAAALAGPYDAAVVVPVYREAISFLDGLEPALAEGGGRALLIVVVNAPVDASETALVENARLLEALAARSGQTRVLHDSGTARAVLGQSAACDLLWLDRSSRGRGLPAREGVGRARRIGLDLALRLWVDGKLDARFLGTTDADATLPSGYLGALARAGADRAPAAASALLFPFRHVPSGDPDTDQATFRYELSLRYHVLGLGAAGSPYAYHSIGSTLAIDPACYAAVRGVPKRAAGEDFYLLDKLAKVAPIFRSRCAPVQIRARRSDRVPFGTGPRVEQIALGHAAGSELRVTHPGVFDVLRAWLYAVDAFSQSGASAALRSSLAEHTPDHAAAAERAAETLGAFAALDAATRQAPSGPALRRRAHTWFDALRTLRFLHLVRDEARLADLPLERALGEAWFLGAPTATARLAAQDPAEACRELERLELAAATLIGPTL